ncbi:hypothetical protein DFAR_1930019 [Desulfarculales bacterium]
MGASGFGGMAFPPCIPVHAYFDAAPTAIWLRHFRYPDCRAVTRLQPRGYWSRFQASAETIRQ